MKNLPARPFVLALLLAVMFLFAGCGDTNPGNKPYEPDDLAPAAHAGVFVSEHGTMTFSGDGKSVEISFDEELAAWTGLPAGDHSASYVFLSGDLPPNGRVPVRYDVAHELRFAVGEQLAVIELGIAAEDGKSAQSGVGTVTPERIPLLFQEDSCFSVIFEKKA